MESYGKELILDLHSCDASLFTRASLQDYFKQLCRLIGMERHNLHFWDDYGVLPEEQQTDSHLKGTSAIQFILTSNITVHTLDILKAVYINVFSCKEFDAQKATNFTVLFFRAKDYTWRVLDRI